ncbi:MAG TPA: Hsp20/alpha crystallin family protein [Dictyoglomaceae bacterium]|nr:Hsp20/alpha crystallin family protein [Dictyoglomaceae bacterium]
MQGNNPFKDHVFQIVDCFHRESSRFSMQWGAWVPRIDIYETDDKIVLLVEIAGVRKEDIDLTFQEGKLILRGTRQERYVADPEIYYQMEINFGPFERVIYLPAEVDPEKAEAVYRDGFLEIALPKK